jgi:hypothetical protein
MLELVATFSVKIPCQAKLRSRLARQNMIVSRNEKVAFGLEIRHGSSTLQDQTSAAPRHDTGIAVPWLVSFRTLLLPLD